MKCDYNYCFQVYIELEVMEISLLVKCKREMYCDFDMSVCILWLEYIGFPNRHVFTDSF